MSYLHLGQDLSFAEPPVPSVRPPAPAFRFIPCGAGRAPHAANECLAIVRRAIRDAVWLADNAASKLKARDDRFVGEAASFARKVAH
ncbi:MAG: hypothetical protein WBV90_18235 [Terrimicrobiaceae bacterium]